MRGETMMGLLLAILEFLEFLASPVGLTVSLWISFYFVLVQVLSFNVLLAVLVPAIPMIDLYFLLKRLEY
ncbi:hypothetical protein H6F88_29985 [Oculatella sp. FACHB-28]|uniref:hypothetical protein n=1 Tax=Cyanophyceae TaxID=3028117 RepID=UPI001684F0B9|nr:MULTISPECIES: hypothetical protein [Cyanophyceae]MBD2060177.1 hypothetical protein [Oculatella sp. FACHB-28]